MCDPITLTLAAVGAVAAGATEAGVAGVGIASVLAAGAIGATVGTAISYAGQGVYNGAKSLLGSDSSTSPATNTATDTTTTYKAATQASGAATSDTNSSANRSRSAILSSQNIQTSSQGALGTATTAKKTLLGQ